MRAFRILNRRLLSRPSDPHLLRFADKPTRRGGSDHSEEACPDFALVARREAVGSDDGLAKTEAAVAGGNFRMAEDLKSARDEPVV